MRIKLFPALNVTFYIRKGLNLTLFLYGILKKYLLIQEIISFLFLYLLTGNKYNKLIGIILSVSFIIVTDNKTIISDKINLRIKKGLKQDIV